ncbi:FAD-dependent oxidoreductase [Candidatus Woesearchaeota archaeon]|nr:FAD-dependent oxidoreductase [Candidatus Woesearchaeota archaeon]
MNVYDVMIIGAGPAGLAAALYAGRKKLKTAVVSIDIGGQGNLTSHIENYPGVFPQPGMELMEKFHSQALRFGAELILGKASEIHQKQDLFEVSLASGETYVARALILTFGKVPRQLGIPGEDKFMGRGVSTCATCDAPLYKNKSVAVVGGGNSAVEAALELANHAKKVYLIHRRTEFRADGVTVDKVKASPRVELVLESIPLEIKGEKFVTGILVENLVTNKKKVLAVDGLFLEIGYVVDTSIAKDLVEVNENKELVVDSLGRTTCAGIFAAGDVTNTPFKQTIIAAGDGARAALQAYAYLTGKRVGPDWAH